MKFWKSSRTADSIENDTFVERLNAIAVRGKLDLAPQPVAEDGAPPLISKRRFWTPDELVTESGAA
jgi:hypothetical protein